MQHFRHRRSGYIDALFRQTAFMQILSRMLRIRQVDIGNDIDDPAVCFFRQTFVFAAVPGFHMENGNMQTLGGDRR